MPLANFDSLGEYNQGFVQHPALILQLRLTGAKLVDLTDPAILTAEGVSADIHICEWRDIAAQGETPPSWKLAERLRSDGADGVIYPSFMSPGGRCVALWRWNAPGGPALEAIDRKGGCRRTRRPGAAREHGLPGPPLSSPCSGRFGFVFGASLAGVGVVIAPPACPASADRRCNASPCGPAHRARKDGASGCRTAPARPHAA